MSKLEPGKTTWIAECCYPGLKPFTWRCQAIGYDDALRVTAVDALLVFPPGFEVTGAVQGEQLCAFVPGVPTYASIVQAEQVLIALRDARVVTAEANEVQQLDYKK